MRLGAVSLADSSEYLRHRFALAGYEKELFTRDAVALVHEASGGVHRELDRLATLALREAARRKKNLIERDAVSAVLDADGRPAA